MTSVYFLEKVTTSFDDNILKSFQFCQVGEYLVLEKTQSEMARHVLFPVPSKIFGKGILVSQTYWGNLLLGPTSRTPEDKHANNEVLQSIVHSAHRLVPEIDVRRTITSYAGMRAKCDRGDFIVEESKVSGFINVAGIDSPGLTSSPAVAKLVLDIIKSIYKRDIPDELQVKPPSDFQPYRAPIVRSKDGVSGLRIDASDPTINIICRCERITESEIVDALYRPLAMPTLTSIKRRTRAGMGSCQGRFCLDRVRQVVAKELAMAKEQIKELEPGSSLLPHRRVTDEDREMLAHLDPTPLDDKPKPKM